MNHECTLEENEETGQFKWLSKFKNKLRHLFLISPEHPLSMQDFKSDLTIQKEQQRQLDLGYCVIHPFSIFRVWYDIWLMVLLTSLMITKPIDAGFMTKSFYDNMIFYKYWTMFTDAMCCTDIIVNCLTGYHDPHLNIVELNRSKIVKNYVLSMFFITDLLSSTPRSLLYWKTWKDTIGWKVHGTANVFCLLKIIRLPTLMSCVYRVAHYFGCHSKGKIFLICSVCVSTIVIHYMACLHFAIPRLVDRYYVKERFYTSWIYQYNLFDKPLRLQYTMCFFKSSALILGIRLVTFKITHTEEYLLAICTYIIGKFLLAFVWIILAVAILNSRSMDSKFFEIINQLDEYMKQKHVPLNLKSRIMQYYDFKYQKKYFKENIHQILSTNLKADVDKHVCKSLIKNVTLFAELTPPEVSKLVKYLIPEVFLPNDIIAKSGTYADSMYFLSNGTVAVYTRSGKEICHLQDGAYFGEVSLILKSQWRIVTVIAIETTYVFRLNRKDFLQTLYNNETVLKLLVTNAEKRLKIALDTEEIHNKDLVDIL